MKPPITFCHNRHIDLNFSLSLFFLFYFFFQQATQILFQVKTIAACGGNLNWICTEPPLTSVGSDSLSVKQEFITSYTRLSTCQLCRDIEELFTLGKSPYERERVCVRDWSLKEKKEGDRRWITGVNDRENGKEGKTRKVEWGTRRGSKSWHMLNLTEI